MWLTCSSIGRKLVMAVTGAALVLFVTFHCLMNGVALFWPSGYNAVCEFLGANWYALAATVGLAALIFIHIIYALWLTIQNRKARGADRYNITSRPKQVEWASKNMLVLGIVVLAFLVVHMIQFWAKMQLAEILGTEYHTPCGAPVPPAAGTLFIQIAFSQVWTPIVYIIGFVALWFHMNHGFWSMFQSAGWDNDVWINRLKCIGCWWTTIVIGLFIAEAVVFTVRANRENAFADQYQEYLEWKNADNALGTDVFNAGEPFSPQANGACMKAHGNCPQAAAQCPEAGCPEAQCQETQCQETQCQEGQCAQGEDCPKAGQCPEAKCPEAACPEAQKKCNE